ncbi:hypothetical protein [Pantoea agglomerans]|uniref:hypothetical protein n=1 Tax=Enterobacter agglomerans TaxID=549 RepID=UPI0002554134|nr:hypothetical protein [Pantoea agglomerans]
MRERPILLNGDMVRAVLNGSKTQTRRMMKVQPSADFSPMNMELETDFTARWYTPGVVDKDGYLQPAKKQVFGVASEDEGYICPFGAVGDRLWVRETFATLGNEDGCAIDWNDNLIKEGGPDAARIYRASCEQRTGNYGLWSIPDDAPWKPHTENMQYEGTWVPSIHMPRWASRITLEITGVRVERLQAINHDDSYAEGIHTEVWDQTVVAKNYREPDSFFQFWSEDMDHFVEMDELYRCSFGSLWQSIYGADSWQANPWVWVIEFKRVEVE